MTKTRARQLARRARQYGHFHPAGTDLYYVYCPLRCGARCETHPWIGRQVNQHLDDAVVDHLLNDCPSAKDDRGSPPGRRR